MKKYLKCLVKIILIILARIQYQNSACILLLLTLLSEFWMDDRILSTGILPPLTESLFLKINFFIKFFVPRFIHKSLSSEFFSNILNDKSIYDYSYLLEIELGNLNKANVTDITNLEELLEFLIENIFHNAALILMKNPQGKDLIISIFLWFKDNKDLLFDPEHSFFNFLVDRYSNGVKIFEDPELNFEFKEEVYKALDFFDDLVSKGELFYDLPYLKKTEEFIASFTRYFEPEAILSDASISLISKFPLYNFYSIVFEEKDLFEIKKSLNILYNIFLLPFASAAYDLKNDKAVPEIYKNIISCIYILPFSYDQVENDF